jgi:hypothetical protein
VRDDRGHQAEAEALLVKVLAMSRRFHQGVALALSNVGSIWTAMGRAAEADILRGPRNTG